MNPLTLVAVLSTMALSAQAHLAAAPAALNYAAPLGAAPYFAPAPLRYAAPAAYAAPLGLAAAPAAYSAPLGFAAAAPYTTPFGYSAPLVQKTFAAAPFAAPLAAGPFAAPVAAPLAAARLAAPVAAPLAAAPFAAAPFAARLAAPVAAPLAAPVAAPLAAAPVAAPLAAAPVAAPLAAPVAPVLAKTEIVDAYPQYRFAYDVQDTLTGDSKTQEETRDGDVVRGSYSLIEADGSRRIVSYYADDINGFNAVVQKDVPVVAAPVPVAPVVAKLRTFAAAPVAAPAPLLAKTFSAPIVV
ncbi:cuticle protein 21 [Drosophila grimshawi]|uniref:GH15933 n=1 Tax=Drosophila grimshawi TaxID=7222 RepID=B4J1G4_DROGR|nr:cuticle protein 21 [Drosophila grimshawi]EDV95855.1 GH15933 [Drosophila grimshawi]